MKQSDTAIKQYSENAGQQADVSLSAPVCDEQRSNGNDTILHDRRKAAEADRKKFNQKRASYWKERAKDFAE